MVHTVLCNPFRVLVTGATGFIGSTCVSFLIKNNNAVAILKKEKSSLKNLDVIKDKFEIVSSDTYNDIYLGIKTFKPDVVVHFAALAHIYKHKPEDVVDLINANITFGAHVLEAMKENNSNQFLNIGTQWQHLGNERYCPVNLYAATKEAFKDILIYYESAGIRHKTVELFDTYGKGDTRKKIMDLLITACREKTPLDLTPGEQFLNLSSVDDICDFLVSHIGIPDFFDNETIALSGNVIKLRDLGTMIEQHFNTQGVLRWGAKPYREHEVMIPPAYYEQIPLNQDSLEKYINTIADTKGK